jgi:hypothetical protein
LLWTDTDRPTNLNKFDYLESTLSPLVLGDKGLMTVQPRGQLMLGEFGLFARKNKPA